MEFFDQVRRTFQAMDERITRMEGRLDTVTGQLDAVKLEVGMLKTEMGGLRTDLQSVGGAFAGIEATLIAQAATNNDFRQRIEALERRAS